MEPFNPITTAELVMRGDTCIAHDLPESVHAALKGLATDYKALRTVIEAEIVQLDEWQRESIKGGWSTHQVDAMRRRCTELRNALILFR